MDRLDLKLLEALQQDGRMPNVQLAETIGLSESPTFRRVKLLEESGMIRGYVALLDQIKLGLQVTAFVSVRMERQSNRHDFHQCVEDEPHITECYAMSGGFDFLMKVVVRDIDHFAALCMQDILNFPGVQHVESSFSLKAVKSSHALPVNP